MDSSYVFMLISEFNVRNKDLMYLSTVWSIVSFCCNRRGHGPNPFSLSIVRPNLLVRQALCFYLCVPSGMAGTETQWILISLQLLAAVHAAELLG